MLHQTSTWSSRRQLVALLACAAAPWLVIAAAATFLA